MSKKKHEWTRKGVTASMAVVMAFGMVPATSVTALAKGDVEGGAPALAADEAEGPESTIGDPESATAGETTDFVAGSEEVSGNTYYVNADALLSGDGSESHPFNSLLAAIEIAEPGDVIKLGSNIVVDSKICVTEAITIDGCGYTVSTGSDWQGSDNSNKHLLGIEGAGASGAIIENIVLDSCGKAAGVQAFDAG